MSYKLVIVESPAKARTIQKFLGRTYKVEASQGHVRDLPKSQMGVDVENDFEPKYITIRGRGEILDRIRKAARGAKSILLATDPDREGEAISWHLANILKIDPTTACRVEFHEITKKTVKNAIKEARPINMELVNAQQARRVVDRLVGYKVSPLLWMKIKKGLSAGRVQSVATRMVVDRESEIDAFIPEEYWDVNASVKVGGRKLAARLSALDGKKAKIESEGEAQQAKQTVEASEFTISKVKHSERKKNPAPPFTTSNLQQEASRKLGFTASKTMQIAQQLYEGIDIAGQGTQGVISYIRTDSVRVSEEAIEQVREMIEARFGSAFVPEQPNVYKGRKNAQDAHEAIRPVDISNSPEDIKASLSKDQFNLYRLIYQRFTASQMKSALYDTLTIEMTNDGATLRHYGEHKKFAGFTALYEEGTDEVVEKHEQSVLASAIEGEGVAVSDVQTDQHFTQPPARYTEASLVKTLEEKGIGRPSTYAPTISTILARGYVAREKKRLHPTELGIMVTEMMVEYFPDIVDSQFTADMEDSLDQVEEGSIEWKQIVRDFYGPFEKELLHAEASIEKIEVKDEVSDIVCDKCGAMMVYKFGRFGRFLACPNFPECRNTKAILIPLNVPCPKCGKTLLEKTSRKGRKFYGCEGYPDCDFVSWDMPVEDKCPICGGYMTLKRARKGEIFHICANEQCRHKVEVQEAQQESDEE